MSGNWSKIRKTIGGTSRLMAAAAASSRLSGHTNIDIEGCSKKMAGKITAATDSIVMNCRAPGRVAYAQATAPPTMAAIVK